DEGEEDPMKPSLKRIALAVALAASTGAAQADNWGCEVMLCLSNPAGPRAVPECKGPIDRLEDHLRHGGSFPTCQLSNGAGSASAGTYARQNFTYYDPCPAGTSALAAGARGAAARDAQLRTARFDRHQTLWVAQFATGIGSGDGTRGVGVALGGRGLPPKVCVGPRAGQAYAEIADADGSVQQVPVDLYDRVELLRPYASPRVIDVYVDNTLYQRVRW
ncbi:MAG: hypothetical protein WBP72_04120, partial [Rhodocyclaceae bacterium]